LEEELLAGAAGFDSDFVSDFDSDLDSDFVSDFDSDLDAESLDPESLCESLLDFSCDDLPLADLFP
jgi:hypothetical protein